MNETKMVLTERQLIYDDKSLPTIMVLCPTKKKRENKRKVTIDKIYIFIYKLFFI